jgi:ABC-type lipoprotein release transport system permease subunit
VLDNSFEVSQETEFTILKNNNVTAVTSRLESFALIASETITKGCMVVGIQPEKENEVTRLTDKMSAGRYLNEDDHAVILATGLAERLSLRVNDTVILIGQGYHGATAAGKYPIAGMITFGSPELNDQILFMPLATAQDFFSAYGMATSGVLSLADVKQIQLTTAKVRSSLGEGFEVMTWEEMMPEVKQHIESESNEMKYIQGILYLLICFGIFGTLLMMMAERKFEMGMLVAIGMKKSKLILLLVLESVFTLLAGCLLGILTSIPVVYYFNMHPIRFSGETAEAYEQFGFEAILPTSTSADNFIEQGLIVLVVGLILSLYPVYKVIRLDPVTAMKR